MDVLDAARRLDKHDIPSRYPNGFAASYPGKLYTKGEAEQAIADATSSSNSAGADYLDKARRVDDLREAVRRAATRVPSVRRAVLFGSLATGVPTPRSDADLLIVVETSSHAQPRDRVPELLRAMNPLPCPIDLLVLTTDEFEGARERNDPLVREALTAGIDLLQDN